MASELDDLRSFMEQRFADAFPEEDTSAGSVADVKVITPLIDRLSPDPFDSPIEAFLRGRMASEYPDLVLQDGEPIDDFAIKPNRVFLEPLRRQIQAISRNQSIRDPSVLNDREADYIAANFFASRVQGKYSVGVARLYFSSPRYVEVTATNAVFTADGLRFFPVENQAITADDMIFKQSGALFYFDIVVRAENQGGQYNIDRGALVGIEGLPEVIKVENRVEFGEGLDRETTAEFLARTQTGLTEKSLTSARGIRARLTDLFDSIRSISVIGHNDVEMERDILTGSPGATYAFGTFTASTSSSSISVTPGNVTNGSVGADDFEGIELQIGDVFRYPNLGAGTITDYTVTELISPVQARVTPAPPTLGSPTPFMILGPNRGQLTISDIPGGILEPETPEGTITVESNQVHLGGKTDVFVRAGDPQSRLIELSAIRDAQPRHFGIDLESFGVEADEFIQITDKIADAATTDTAFVGPGDTSATVYIKVLDTGDDTVPWRPTSEDVGRYLQLLGTDDLGTDFGMYEIQGVGAEQDFGGERAIPLTITTLDENTGTDTVGISDRSSAYDLDFRIVELVSVKYRVRDRANPQADFNGNNNGLGVQVGDSVVIESGSDAGIFSIRRILTWEGEDDTLILDRELTATKTPTGAGDGSGLRYRVADELQLDLISPRVTKMPLGSIFPADDLQTVANSSTVMVSTSSNFLLAGIAVGDTLEINEGPNAGTYEILSPVAGTSLEVSPAPPTTAFNQSFSIYTAFEGVQRPLVRVEEVQLLDSSNQETGITVPYGKEVDVRVLGTFSNRAAGRNVESFTGAVDTLPNLFEDTNVNFDAQGVRVGDRLEIFEGENLGEYEISEVYPDGGLTVNQVRVHSTSTEPGAKDFIATETELHYQIGEPSTGLARVYFLDPTSVDILTGISGGRLRYEPEGSGLSFRFSKVQGRTILPAPGSGDDNPRDLRVARSWSIGGGEFNTVLEITDAVNNPDTYEAEILPGDVFVVQEQIPFANSGGTPLKDAGIFGTPAGLRTTIGSNRVSVPDNSNIDFLMMGDLAGQTLAIESGADEGIYRIERVVSAKVLDLSAVMTSSTLGIIGLEVATLYDATIEDISGAYWLEDTTDPGQLPPVGSWVTIFEADDGAIEGTFEVTAVDIPNARVLLDGFPSAGSFPKSGFAWVATNSSTPSGVVEYPFNIYQTIGKEVVVEQVATKADDITPAGDPPTGAVQAGLTTFLGASLAFLTTKKGDRLEILSGANKGVYPIETSNADDQVTVYSAHPFSAVSTADPYRVWGGVHGSRRMVTVGPFEGSTGKIDPGDNLIYTILRPALFRYSSTEMEDQVDDSGLYYVDLAVESLGPGDNRNLPEGARLVVESGLSADGYTYSVENRALSFSMYEEVSLNFDRRFLPVGNSDLPENRTELNGRNLQIQYSTSSTVQLINDLLRSDAERPNNSDPIARHFLPSFVRTQLVYSGGSSTQVTGPDVEDHVNELGPLDVLEVSDLEALLTRRGATSVTHPILLVAVTHDLERNLVVERSENALGGTVVPYDGTARISSFFADLEDGLTITRN